MADLTPLERGLELFDGKQARFARAIGTSQQNVSNWVRKGQQLPAEYVLSAEEATEIPRHVWRPDIYPIDRAASRVAICSACDRHDGSPEIRSCTRTDCPMVAREAQEMAA